MLVMTDCAKNYASTTYQSLVNWPVTLAYSSTAPDFTIGNILSFNQYFGRHGLPSSGSYI